MDKRTICGTECGVLGYGCMRFPIDRETHAIDEEKAAALIARAMEAGVTYYDTAWFYHGGKSEDFMGRTLSAYPRARYCLATKLPCGEVTDLDRAKEIFAAQLRNLRTDYLDFYLLHGLNARAWHNMLELGVVDWLCQVQRTGVIRKLGFSFHDDYAVFEEILSYRDWDFCQIQLNYMDTQLQAGMRGYELAAAKGVPLVIMEPAKGGLLATLPDDTAGPLRDANAQASHASWAMRWIGSLPNVKVVLSGMTTMEQLEENLATFSDFRPLTEPEYAAIEGTRALLNQKIKNGCTGCRYCMPCPAGVDIPRSFNIWNKLGMFENIKKVRFDWKSLPEDKRPLNCIDCGQCEEKCPQALPIRADLRRAQSELSAATSRKSG